jgi:hypothetical protein
VSSITMDMPQLIARINERHRTHFTIMLTRSIMRARLNDVVPSVRMWQPYDVSALNPMIFWFERRSASARC